VGADRRTNHGQAKSGWFT